MWGLPASGLSVRGALRGPRDKPARGSGRGTAGPLHHPGSPQLRPSPSGRLRPPVLSAARPVATLPTSSPTGQRREEGAPAPGPRSPCGFFPRPARRGPGPLSPEPTRAAGPRDSAGTPRASPTPARSLADLPQQGHWTRNQWPLFSTAPLSPWLALRLWASPPCCSNLSFLLTRNFTVMPTSVVNFQAHPRDRGE